MVASVKSESGGVGLSEMGRHFVTRWRDLRASSDRRHKRSHHGDIPDSMA